MKTSKLFLIIFMLVTICNIFAAFYTITFRETAATGVPTTTRTSVLTQNASYPLSPLPAAADRWVIQVYKSTDNIISPLNSSGLPTGDDIVTVTNVPSTQGLVFATTNVWLMSSLRFYDDGVTGNTYAGDKVYLRIFNASSIASATKYIESTSLYTIPSANATVNYIPTYGWSSWVTFVSTPVPNPVEMIAPTNGGTGLAYASQTLSWTPSAFGGTPTGYKVYFGSDYPPTDVVNGTPQTATTYVTGELLPFHTYFWKIIPFNTAGEASNITTWSFTTRDEVNPNSAINPSPVHGATVNTTILPYDQTLSWSPPSQGVIPTGYKFKLNNSDTLTDLGNVLTTEVSITNNGINTWIVVPYYTDPGTRSVRLGDPVTTRATNSSNDRGDAIGCPTWEFLVNLQATYNVDITSTPTDADIFAGGIDTGFNTPHQFKLVEGSSATYTVQKAGYTWSPESFPVTNIQADTSQAFTGTLIPYTVDISSSPSNADIFVGGVDSGYNTPHQFIMNYGTSATYSVQKAGYSWLPASVPVNNIQANTSQAFTGSILTYTVDISSTPTGADIIVSGINPSPLATNLFFSEYIEGISNNKAIEIFNGTGQAVDLTQYSVKLGTNGNPWSTVLALTGTLANNDVYIIANPGASPEILIKADINSTVTFFNGNDALGLFNGTTLIDAIGVVETNPGVAWDVAGVTTALLDHTIVRKPSISSPTTNWTLSAGTNTEDSQWIVYPMSTYTYLGSHNVDSGYNTPHTFTLDYGTNATFAAQKAGYNWSPTSFPVSNIQANTSQVFTGTLQTFTVDITSSPSDADIFIGGVDSGYNTPHQFIMDYGTSATYTVQKTGYSFDNMADFVVTNIQENQAGYFLGSLLTYTVDITSTPAGAVILVNGVREIHNTTPHQFVMNYGTSATYTVEMPGYTFTPTEFVVTNIQENKNQNFTGTIITYTVDITSTPTDADIYIGGTDSGFKTPHQFIMEYGTSAIYTVQKTAYSWLPVDFVVSSIRANTSMNFTGTQTSFYVDITSYPTDADIFADGEDTGLKTPYQFLLPEGTNVTYTVQKAGYSWDPVDFVISDISADTSQNFTGTLLTYTVDITSIPTDANIIVDGIDSGFNTPHQFVMDYGTSATYSVQADGYTWSLADLAITNIQENTSQEFVGTLLTYTVDITSIPSGALIHIGASRPALYTTPHQFVMNYGTSALYYLSMPGYTWSPDNFSVINIQADTSQVFIGTINTYTVDITSSPADADIFVDGIDTGYNTPHQFVMNYGTNANYSVQKVGYTWLPESFAVNDIRTNTSQNFTGTQIAYVVEITSTPTNASIYVNEVYSGFTTPHQFALSPGDSATYTVQKAGYTWQPADFLVSDISQNESQHFTGTLLTYTVDITSTPSEADIFVDGIDTGYNSPHQFVLDYGSNAIYTVQKAGYTWSPESFPVENIQESTSQLFTGTKLTYTVDITSNPSGAEIFVRTYSIIGGRSFSGLSTGYSTPHQFVLEYGSNETYFVEKPGYTWAPEQFYVNNIQENTSQNFVGTILTYTVDITSTPSDADIFVGGVDTGYNSPHQFVLDYGSNATYTLQKAGYTWAPADYAVTNIQSNLSQAFAGTIITYTVDIASAPSEADIFVGGVDSGYNTPHQFIMNYGSSATYTVQKAGYSWSPENFVVNNIQTNLSQLFEGSLLTYTVDITSTPSGANINVNGLKNDMYTTPHQFVMTYGSSDVYSVDMPGYSFEPEIFSVENIQANTSQHFVGTILTYTVDITSSPSDADIFVGGVDTGFNSPHQFILNYGSNANYTVQKAGYTWSPGNFYVTSIQENTSMNFEGTLLTYTVDITSNPSGAEIFIRNYNDVIGRNNNDTDTGFTTPHRFVLDYGTYITYYVEQPGYTWLPTEFVINNLQANTGQLFVGTLLTYTVDVTSTPADADIFVGGIDTGYNTPHQFISNYGTSAFYTVHKAGYTWEPPNYGIEFLQENYSVNFVGTLITYNVDIASTPSDADIFVNGIDTGFNTPHRFVMTYGSSASYTLNKPGYVWQPDPFVVTNIQSDISQLINGIILTYTVNLTSTPSDADIFVNGFDSGFNTPHIFTLDYGTEATYTVQKAGYTWSPASFPVTNIQANTSQAFTGTIITYTVDITSTPTNSDIFVNGQDSGFNTPHQFVMNYGTNATYTVQNAAYYWNPTNFVVTNIQANTSRNFIGTLITYTVDITSNPTGADIFEGGVDTGFNTPHQFILAQGAGGVYTVQKAGYSYTPANFVVTNIMANTSQAFTGTILTYTVNITSNPTDADIFVDGTDTGFNSPHQFVLEYNSSARYTVQKEGYTWSPAFFLVSNIQANASQLFTGTIITYPVDITSAPSDADIFVNGQDSGFNTPHQFVMNYGTSATYSVQKAGYTWVPSSFVINNIHSYWNSHFVGTIIVHTVDIISVPDNADIYRDGVDTGYNTPHQFNMNYGTSATYSVRKTGYNFAPASFVVNNITSNLTKTFNGSSVTYTVEITSTPIGADIYTDGDDTGFDTPHTFTLNYGSNDNYSVQKPGYTFTPANFVVTNIQANTSQNFTGTIVAYTVDITSSPSGSDIYVNGVDSGFNTPYQFMMNYGSSATYTLQKPGYTWLPSSFVVNNIQENTSRNFVGSQITYVVNITSTPSNADVYIGNEDTGMNTPCQLVLPYGSNATIKVKNVDYSWSPESFVITNLQANTSQNFVGTLLTYVVNVTSNPTDADIFINDQDSGFNSPHLFTVNSGTNATYSVQKPGYSWLPPFAVVNGIHANTDLLFNGTLLAYTVNITSSPANADIFVNGVDSGFNTPYQFVMDYGTNATYTVQMPGYTWSPANYVVTNIHANAAQNFVGTIMTYTANITSLPTDADIFIDGVDSGFNTPHIFTMNYGSSAVYSVQKIGYVWMPETFAVTNITANTSQLFTGSTQTYTVFITSNPTDADILMDGVDTGFNTPHQFVMNHGAGAVYTVQKPQYIWSPTSFIVTNIQANTAQLFTGTQLALTVTPANQNVTNQAGSTSFNVNSNVTWTVTETEDWLTASPLGSVNNGVITVNYDANMASVLRIGTITITGSDITRTVTVTQAAGQPFLTVSPDLQNVTYPEGTTSFEVSSNVAWSVLETESWFSVAPLDGNNSGTLSVAYDVNSSTTPRSGQFIVTGNGITRTVTVTQDATPPSLSFNPAVQNVSYEAGVTSSLIESNIAWTITESVSWLSVSPANGSNNGSITITYVANPGTASRTGVIRLTGSGLIQEMAVIQSGAPATLTVNPILQNVSNFGGTTTFTITSNTSWTVTETESWLSVAPANGVLNGSFNVVFAANPVPTQRTGYVHIAWTGGSRTVTIIQSAGVGIEDPTIIPLASIDVYPNPFATSANIKLDVTNNNNAELVIYSSKGEVIKKLGVFSKGRYTLSWDGRDKAGRMCSNGFYLIRYKSSDLTKTVKVLLIRN